MTSTSSTSDSSAQEIAQKIQSGEFFRESRTVFHSIYHDVMVERYYFIAITIFSLIICTIAVQAIDLMLPLNRNVPFVYKINNEVEDLPRIKRIGLPGQDTNMVLRQFLVSNYVRLREDYDVQILDRSANGIRAQSTPEVFNDYQRIMDPTNPQSPITLFQRQAMRKIEIVSVKTTMDKESNAEVVYDAVIESGRERKKTRMLANITFRFNDITLDEDKGTFSPLEFIVTHYETRKLQDS